MAQPVDDSLRHGPCGTAPAPAWIKDRLEPARKRLRAHASCVDAAESLRGLLQAALPDKESFFDSWLAALAAPSVCVSALDDVKRLDPVDIGHLPVPPLVKGVFRDILAREAAKGQEQTQVLAETTRRGKAFLAAQRDRNMQPPLAGSKYFQDNKNYRLVLTQEELESGVRVVARRLETWSKGERIILVGILKGAFMFMSDLCRALSRPYSVYFVEASSYKDGREQAAGVHISAEIPSAKFMDAVTHAPHKIVLIDELLDNGKTMHEMKQHFLSSLAKTHTENDILTVCLMSKKRPREWPEADITGIPDLPDLWLVGYGLDDRGTKRGWTELFAIPKVRIADVIEEKEVADMLNHLDEHAALQQPLVFGGVELTCNHKQRYRICGIDVLTGHTHVAPSQQNLTKADVQKIVGSIPIVKGKFEHELQFAFIQEGVELVPEDAIFSGDSKIYAEMRCQLRKYISKEARRFNVEGLGEATPCAAN
uniref:Phosphoribosyltransferase domain-containing protein n=1 Tax=Zooxanthella nutricula TaxID=1333877 RepID=A0A7S2NZA6_9DINO|mmetsp:Transcript_44235/g.134055  ORF Transcript_44235/g.134055 Transcript_44235/m.134055 type:complete len:482 (+) Transcript_44235:113-1558(+)